MAPWRATAAPRQPPHRFHPGPRALADQLSQAGVKYYGSWRSAACHYQGRLFGQSAMERLPYVECAKPNALPPTSPGLQSC